MKREAEYVGIFVDDFFVIVAITCFSTKIWLNSYAHKINIICYNTIRQFKGLLFIELLETKPAIVIKVKIGAKIFLFLKIVNVCCVYLNKRSTIGIACFVSIELFIDPTVQPIKISPFITLSISPNSIFKTVIINSYIKVNSSTYTCRIRTHIQIT